jgi:hypothetical protein
VAAARAHAPANILLSSAGTPALVHAGRLSVAQSDLLALGIAALVLPGLGAALFAAGLAKAHNDGGLSRWT